MTTAVKRVLSLALGLIQYFLSVPLMSYRGHVSAEEKLFALTMALIPVLLDCCSVPRHRTLELSGWGAQILILLTCLTRHLWPSLFS
jgi:hypothetical protein